MTLTYPSNKSEKGGLKGWQQVPQANIDLKPNPAPDLLTER